MHSTPVVPCCNILRTVWLSTLLARSFTFFFQASTALRSHQKVTPGHFLIKFLPLAKTQRITRKESYILYHQQPSTTKTSLSGSPWDLYALLHSLLFPLLPQACFNCRLPPHTNCTLRDSAFPRHNVCERFLRTKHLIVERAAAHDDTRLRVKR